jgi:hypothetical protein
MDESNSELGRRRCLKARTTLLWPLSPYLPPGCRGYTALPLGRATGGGDGQARTCTQLLLVTKKGTES